MDLNVKCTEMHGENVEIPRQNDHVEKESARVIQGCLNYETLDKEHALIYILDHEAGLEEQWSMKSRNSKAEWKFKYP